MVSGVVHIDSKDGFSHQGALRVSFVCVCVCVCARARGCVRARAVVCACIVCVRLRCMCALASCARACVVCARLLRVCVYFVCVCVCVCCVWNEPSQPVGHSLRLGKRRVLLLPVCSLLWHTAVTAPCRCRDHAGDGRTGVASAVGQVCRTFRGVLQLAQAHPTGAIRCALAHTTFSAL
jgi:hypothetical protein